MAPASGPRCAARAAHASLATGRVDLLVFSNSAEEHVEHLRRLFAMLKSIGIKLHPEKTVIGGDAVEFLGHLVSAQGMRPLDARVAAFRALQAPSSLSACRRLLGIFNYYTDYLPRYSVLTAPITKLTSQATVWGPET